MGDRGGSKLSNYTVVCLDVSGDDSTQSTGIIDWPKSLLWFSVTSYGKS